MMVSFSENMSKQSMKLLAQWSSNCNPLAACSLNRYLMRPLVIFMYKDIYIRHYMMCTNTDTNMCDAFVSLSIADICSRLKKLEDHCSSIYHISIHLSSFKYMLMNTISRKGRMTSKHQYYL